MILNYIWVAFFVIAFVIAFGMFLFTGDMTIFKKLVDGIFESSKTSVEICISLVGVMTLFMGFMRVGEKAGAINFLSRLIFPFFSKLFPEVPKNHPSIGHMMMNFSANLLGLDNAATPFGIKAMKSLQELNVDAKTNLPSETASNAQIMFMGLHASGLTLIPVSLIALRQGAGSKEATDIFIPCLVATFVASIVSLLVISFRQKITIFQPVILAWLGTLSLFITGIVWFVKSLSDHNQIKVFSEVFSSGLILIIFITFIYGGLLKKINIYDSFIEGAKEGWETAIKIIPYLVAMLIAISVFKNCDALGYINKGLAYVVDLCGLPTDWVAAFPTALMKPLSGGGARGLIVDTMTTYGPDSFVGKLACVFGGSSDTTFYIAAVYFGGIGIKNSRYAIPACLIADLAGVITAILMCYLMFKI
jgi:spore maturation protein SpmA/spore maturation protein SpmB